MARVIADKSSSLGRFIAVKEIEPSVRLWNNKDQGLWVIAREGEAVGTDNVPVFDTIAAAELSWELNPRRYEEVTYRINERYSVGWVDPRGIFGSSDV